MMLVDFSLYAKKLASLPEVIRPSRIVVDNGRLFISDHTVKLHLYSMKDFSYKLFARKGEGPGELRMSPWALVLPDSVFLNSSTRRGMIFSFDGQLLKEYKLLKFSSNRFFPVGKNFAILQNNPRVKKGYIGNEISIYEYNDKINEFKFKKMIYYNEYNIYDRKTSGKWNYPLIKPYYGFIVKDDKVFIGDTDRGFYVEIYDSEGREVSKIRLYQDPIKIDDSFRKLIMQKFKEVPAWKTINDMYHVYFPEYYPAYYRFAVDNQKIYFLTFKMKDKRREVIITDYKGNILRHSYLPVLDEYDVFPIFSIEDDKFYYIKENEDTEEWELHVEDIK